MKYNQLDRRVKKIPENLKHQKLALYDRVHHLQPEKYMPAVALQLILNLFRRHGTYSQLEVIEPYTTTAAKICYTLYKSELGGSKSKIKSGSRIERFNEYKSIYKIQYSTN